MKRDSNIPIYIEFKNTTGATRFFNPKLTERYPMPIGILLFDENAAIADRRGDLFDSERINSGGNGGTEPGWIDKGAISKINATFTIVSKVDPDNGRLLPIRFAGEGDEEQVIKNGIPPGHYYVQVVMWLRAIAPLVDFPGGAEAKHLLSAANKTATGRYDPREYYANPLWFMPLYRSNAVEIDVEVPARKKPATLATPVPVAETESPASPAPAAAEEGVTATLVPDKKEIMTGEPVDVAVTVTNNTQEKLHYSSSKFSVTGADGKEVPVPAEGDGKDVWYVPPALSGRRAEVSPTGLLLPVAATAIPLGDYTLTSTIELGDATGAGTRHSITASATANITDHPSGRRQR